MAPGEACALETWQRSQLALSKRSAALLLAWGLPLTLPFYGIHSK